jgi:hypothetical protein
MDNKYKPTEEKLKQALYASSPHRLGALVDDTYRYYVDGIVKSHAIIEFIDEYYKLAAINKDLLEALKLAVHAINRVPNFPVNCADKNIKNSYGIASICDKAIAKAQGGK